MGRVQVDGAVRHVSPVTARLFAKMGSDALGISSGDVLLAVGTTSTSEPNWRKQHHAEEESKKRPNGRHELLEKYATRCGSDAEERRVEVVRPCTPPPVNGLMCPHAYLESILRERGYDFKTRSSANEGCQCKPTQKQIDDYQIPLVEAVRRLDLSALDALAARGVDMSAANRFGESVVHLATRRGSASVLDFLLKRGASLHICDDYGKTPLHDALWASEPRFDLVSMILERDWKLLRAADVRGATPLRYAKRRHWGQWCDFLDRVKDRFWPHRDANETTGDDEHGSGRDVREVEEGRCTRTCRSDEGGGSSVYLEKNLGGDKADEVNGGS